MKLEGWPGHRLERERVQLLPADRAANTKRKGERPNAAGMSMSEKESISEKLHDFAEKVEADIKEHEEARRKHDKEIDKEKKKFEKGGQAKEANMLALEGEDIVTDD